MELTINRMPNESSVDEILARKKFVCLAPDVSLVTSRVYEKNGKKYVFVGWEEKDGLMAPNPRYIKMRELPAA